MKSTMPKFLFRALTFLVFLVVTFKAADFFICDDVHDYSRMMLEELYGQEENIDILILGSSHSYRSFSPAVIDEMLGTNSFNAGSSQQLYDGSYYLLREAAKTNRLQTVLLEVSNNNYSASGDVPEACYLLADYMKNSPERWEYLWEMGGVGAVLESLTPARHNTISPSSALETWRAKLTDGYQKGNYAYLQSGDGYYRGKGFVYVPYNIGEGAHPAGSENTDPDRVISAFSEEYLHKIISFCKENGIELILIQSPMTDSFLSGDENRQQYMDYFSKIAAENGFVYWDMNLCTADVLRMNWKDFSDGHHLSGEGAEKASAALGQLLRETSPGQREGRGFFYESYAQKLAENPDGTR